MQKFAAVVLCSLVSSCIEGCLQEVNKKCRNIAKQKDQEKPFGKSLKCFYFRKCCMTNKLLTCDELGFPECKYDDTLDHATCGRDPFKPKPPGRPKTTTIHEIRTPPGRPKKTTVHEVQPTAPSKTMGCLQKANNQCRRAAKQKDLFKLRGCDAFEKCCLEFALNSRKCYEPNSAECEDGKLDQATCFESDDLKKKKGKTTPSFGLGPPSAWFLECLQKANEKCLRLAKQMGQTCDNFARCCAENYIKKCSVGHASTTCEATKINHATCGTVQDMPLLSIFGEATTTCGKVSTGAAIILAGGCLALR